jgi:hypothetical protein
LKRVAPLAWFYFQLVHCYIRASILDTGEWLRGLTSSGYRSFTEADIRRIAENLHIGLLAAVSRIAAIQSNDLAPTNMNGPELPFRI